jgi:cobalamin biosynthesis Mg chelatase CobN
MSQGVKELGWACGSCTSYNHRVQEYCNEVVSGRCWLYREKELERKMKLNLKPNIAAVEIIINSNVYARREKTGTESRAGETLESSTRAESAPPTAGPTESTPLTEHWSVWKKNSKNPICTFELYYSGRTWTLGMNDGLIDDSIFEAGRILLEKRNLLKASIK